MGRAKFLIGGLVILAAVVYLIVSSTQANAEDVLTINELKAKGAAVVGRNVHISGAVIGDTIQYDPKTLTLTFTVANVTANNAQIDASGGLAAVLHEAVINPSAERLQIVVVGQAKPDLLKNEAEAIMTGHLDESGVFHADELLLKCPTKYEDAAPTAAA